MIRSGSNDLDRDEAEVVEAEESGGAGGSGWKDCGG